MARKKKTEEVVEKKIVEETVIEKPVEFAEAMNPPEEVKIENTLVEEQPKKRVIKFTPVGPKVEYI